MKLYIDMIAFYLQKAGGITNVWKEIIIRMLQDRQSVILILQEEECENIYFEQLMTLKPDVVFEKGTAKRNRYRNVSVSMEDGSNFVSTYYRVVLNKKIKQITLVHDFTYEYYVKGLRKWVHSWQKRRSVKFAGTIICVSNNTMSDLLGFYPWAQNKNRYVIYNGVSDAYHYIDNKNLNISEINDFNNKKFFVFVGSRALYKRFDFAIDITEHYTCGLIVIGGGDISDNEEILLKKKLGNNWLHLTGIPDTILNKIYNKAAALLYPSEYEGFGIPVIEAQKARCPVIARKGSSLDEVIGNQKLLMKNNSIEEAERVMNMYFDQNNQKDILDQGENNACCFTWNNAYNKYKNILFEM